MAKVDQRNPTLTSNLAAGIRQAVAGGGYSSTSEVVPDPHAACNQARQGRESTMDALRRLWREGVDSGDARRLTAQDIKRRGRERLAARAAADR